jgi:hypothetical protein
MLLGIWRIKINMEVLSVVSRHLAQKGSRFLARNENRSTIQNLVNKGNGHSGERQNTPKPNPVRRQALVLVISASTSGLV